VQGKFSLALMDERYFTRLSLSNQDSRLNLSHKNVPTFQHSSHDYPLCFVPVMITDLMMMTLQIPSSPPLQSSHPIMKLSFNLWELSLISIVKRPYVLNKMVRKQREKYLPDFPWSLRRIKPIHHTVLGNPIERRKMSLVAITVNDSTVQFISFRSRFRSRHK
jgi:hypothetical protein